MGLFFEEDNGGKKKECQIWAIGGGKGGTGKSFLTSSMGTYLATHGNRVVLIDADLGGANLHSFLGIKRPRTSLTDFFDKKVPLSNIIVGTGIADMGLVTGDLHSLNSGSIKYTQKQKLFRQIKSLDTDFILIDLGAGSHFNTIDTFLLADRMIVVIVPEITSIENMYHFIKSVIFRKLDIALSSIGLKQFVRDIWKNRGEHGINNLRELIDYLSGVSSSTRDVLQKELSEFRIQLVLNQVRSSQDVSIGVSVRSICMKYFGLFSSYVGYVEYDDCIWNSINKRQSFMKEYSGSRCAIEIQRIADNVVQQRQLRVLRR
ncbi:chromosome partitioning protein ParA [bacterium BMS3Abin07]|nr:chromosome partitioning protein ParA [bacterium BMS3Abin07]GBE31933.1 chromosome partitioning protein ParA [bacterium BMS3Bbin05]HDL20569.1 MinD/ParA family protein [Nitrospirota bacterium]HDO23066.1 MinD/ParA family protein [Nitrospirota bacterium]